MTPLVIAHRGACGHAPENTLAAMRKAAQMGVAWVEFDTRLSRDGKIIVFHDDSLDRTTNASGLVAKYDWAELKDLDAGGWYAKRFTGEPICTLGEMIDELSILGLGANIEIKPAKGREIETGAMVSEFVKQKWPDTLPDPLLSSFMPNALQAAGEAAPGIFRALCVNELGRDWRQLLGDLGCSAVHCAHDKLDAQQATAVLDAGFALRCFTVNEAPLAKKLFTWGVEAVFSDYPERILNAAVQK